MTSTCLYRIALHRADGTIAVEYRRLKRPTTPKGFDRQHNNVVNSIREELRYHRVEGWKRFTVTRVASTELHP